MHRYRFNPTVAYGNNEVNLNPTEPRRLSVREALRLQTVPDEYVLPKGVSLTHEFKLISKGVPTAKAGLIAREIRRTLELFLSHGGKWIKRLLAIFILIHHVFLSQSNNYYPKE